MKQGFIGNRDFVNDQGRRVVEIAAPYGRDEDIKRPVLQRLRNLIDS